MTNLVAIEIRAADLTGTAFSGVLARVETLKKALASMSGVVTIDSTALDDALAKAQTLRAAIGDDSGAVTVNTASIDDAMAKAAALKAAVGDDVGAVLINTGDIDSQLSTVKSKLQAHGIADLLDVNLNQGQMDQQLLVLKRKIGETGITDLLDFNANTTEVTTQIGELERQIASTSIPLNVALDTSQVNLANLPKLAGTENISITGGVSSSTMQDVSEFDDALTRATEDYALLISEMNDMRTPDILAAMPDLNDFDLQLHQLGEDLAALSTPAGMSADAMADVEMRITAAGNAVDEFEREMPQALEDLANFGAAAGAATVALAPDRYAAAAEEMSGVGQAAEESGSAIDGLKGHLADVGTAMAGFNTAIGLGIPLWSESADQAGFLAGHVQLFGGALTNDGLPAVLGTVSGMHLLLDGIIETAAVLVPAAIAFGAFAIMAVPSVIKVYDQVENLRTATAALNDGINPAVENLHALGNAAQPAVLQLFGEYMVLAGSKTGGFSQAVSAAGKVLDDLGARFVAAQQSAKGFGGFLDIGVADMAGIGNVIGNVGGIFGNFMKAVPGYAEILLGLLQVATHMIEVFTGFAEPVLAAGLAFHGLLVYGGLAITGIIALSGVLGKLGTTFTTLGLEVASYVESIVVADGATASFEAAIAPLAAINPFTWVLAAGAALAGLIVWMSRSKDAAQQFGAALNSTVSNSSISNVTNTLLTAITETTTKLNAATEQLNSTQEYTTVQQGKFGPTIQMVTQAYAQQAGVVSQYKSELADLTTQAGTYSTRLQDLGKQYGGVAAAQGLLNAAGITTSQMLDKSGSAWAQIQVEVAATVAQMNAMSLGTGRLGADMNALNYSSGATSNTLGNLGAEMSKVTSAQDALMTAVTGSETAFIAFEQGIGTTATAAKAAGSAVGGLSANSLTLSNDFYSTVVPAAQKVIDALESQFVSTGQLTTAVATSAKQMIPFAANNDAARATIVAMINDALGPGTVSLQTLNNWVGKNSTSMTGFNNIVATATIKAGTLANVLSTQLNTEFHNDLLAATGANTALSTYTGYLVKNTQNTTDGQSARAQLIKDLENAGDSAQTATNYVDGLSTALGKVPKNTNVNVNVNGEGSGGVTITGTGTASGQGGIRFTSMASGGIITGGIPGQDSVLLLGMPGEVVIPTDKVAGLAPALKKAGVPGFGTGGVIGGLANVASGSSWYENDFSAEAVLAGVKEAMSTAKAAAAKASLANAGGPTGAGDYSFSQLEALWIKAGGPASAAYNMALIAEAESGGNPNAHNPSGATGLWQILGNPFPGNAYNPLTNAEMAVAKFDAGGYAPWEADPVGARLTGYASGGTTSGGWIGVGEHGRELIKVPGGSTVIPNGTANQMLAGGAAGPTIVQLQVDSSGQGGFDDFMSTWMKNYVRVKGGGSVQKAFGRT